jgi:hypothetical protein
MKVMMAKTKFSEQKLAAISKEITDKSIKYSYRTKDYPLEVIRTKFGKENNPEATLYIPSYQRNFIWKQGRQSRFIESVLLGAPLTPFLVSEDENGRLEIIDGSQRIQTLVKFCNNDLVLMELKILNNLNDSKFSDLPKRWQRFIENRDFRVIVLSKADIAIRKDIFSRINTSSEL